MLTIEIMHPPSLTLELTKPPSLELEFPGVTVTHTDAPRYEGPYEATPTRETQVFETEGLLMAEHFTVNPIPSNYGLITYNGFYMTVT